MIRVKPFLAEHARFVIIILRYLFDEHPEDGGRQSGLPQTTQQGADQLQQEEESG